MSSSDNRARSGVPGSGCDYSPASPRALLWSFCFWLFCFCCACHC